MGQELQLQHPTDELLELISRAAISSKTYWLGKVNNCIADTIPNWGKVHVSDVGDMTLCNNADAKTKESRDIL